jgi:hypothetical protein
MAAAPGAIERVQIIKGELRSQTIDNLDPIGICGSGILDVIACMLQINAADHRGSLLSSHPLVRETGNKREFLLVDKNRTGTGGDITISRQDINEIQLAKGAIRQDRSVVKLRVFQPRWWKDLSSRCFGTLTFQVQFKWNVSDLPLDPSTKLEMQLGLAPGNCFCQMNKEQSQMILLNMQIISSYPPIQISPTYFQNHYTSRLIKGVIKST